MAGQYCLVSFFTLRIFWVSSGNKQVNSAFKKLFNKFYYDKKNYDKNEQKTILQNIVFVKNEPFWNL